LIDPGLLLLVFCFCVPYNGPDGKVFDRLVEIDFSSTYNQTCHFLYKEIGCADVPEQNLPVLACHFSKNAKKKMTDLANWNFIKEEYTEEVDKKGRKAIANIILPENVSLFLLFLNR